MLLNELNLKALNVSTESVLPVVTSICVEGKELTIKITTFQSGYGSGKKSVISGTITRKDNGTEKILENADVEKVRRVVASLCELTTSGRTTTRKPRTQKAVEVKISEVEKLKQSLAVARRLPKEWVTINPNKLRTAFIDARKKDRMPAKLASLTELDAAKQLKAYDLLKKAGLL